MNKIVVVGRGYIGSVIYKFLSTSYPGVQLISSAETSRVEGHVDCIVWASGNSSVFATNNDPSGCLHSSCFLLLQALKKFSDKKWVYISSVSTLGDFSPSQKDSPEYLYGLHKKLAESYVIKHVRNLSIFRVAYLFGKGLRKNLFYDLKFGKKTIYLSPESTLRPINIEHLSASVKKSIEKEIFGIFNAGSRDSISVRQVLQLISDIKYTLKTERHIDQSAIDTSIFNDTFKSELSTLSLPAQLRSFFE